ncbi:hypothetical protein [Rhodococcus globerulus]|uniref:Uncharacterized protein n=1 Tax=Rhodococcus globerulus TaxID=33008 RepID=A0ABU4BS63_RHOGO|nr:hypothetical protein [Rhodococcus globerulus]MDV6267057.1 hypothetical protein [Rhodococcus globerulus]
MSKWVDMGAGVHCAPSGVLYIDEKVLYIDGKPFMAGAPRFVSAHNGIETWEISFTAEESSVSFTTGRSGCVTAWPGGKPPTWLLSETYKHVLAFARELSTSSALPLSECVTAVLNAMSPEASPAPKPDPLQAPKSDPLPKPSTVPPMWAINPGRMRRNAFGPSRRVK